MFGDEVEARLQELARRAGLTGIPPAAVGVALVVFAIAVGFALWRWWPRGSEGAQAQVAVSAPATAATPSVSAPGGGAGGPASGEARPSAGSSASVCVHVVGAVQQPGVYELSAKARVKDAIEAAGGLSPDGAAQALNLARLLADGEQVLVPTQAEYAQAPAASGSGSTGAASSGAGSRAGGVSAGGTVNINTADATQLDTLPGVGPSTAARIVADRETNGPFATVDDLGRVSGIGPKKLEQLKGAISVR